MDIAYSILEQNTLGWHKDNSLDKRLMSSWSDFLDASYRALGVLTYPILGKKYVGKMRDENCAELRRLVVFSSSC